ncbi:MAG: radical SAM/SPASM domain-containing protein [Gammaproteobacteria bacterium]|nr:radical SAM/SPASM domain-containing protein [Gammaproteobacteria bacterium]
MGPTGNTNVVQIHPTRRCNLRCLHCYSSSSPRETEAIEADLLKSAIDGLATEGYNWASFSGGEPLVYAPLAELLSHTKQAGIHTAVVSNGMLLTPRRLDAIRDHVDLLVISLDGKPASHNRIRNSPRAFEAMAMKLPGLRARGIPFGFLFTLTQHNLDELPWVAEFAVNVGARLLQIHPLEHVGNAVSQLPGKVPDAIEGAHAWYLAEQLKAQLAGTMAVQVDLVHTSALEHQPDSFFLGEHDAAGQRRLGDVLSPLVIEPDGEVLPLQYGFPRTYSLGNLHAHSVGDMAARWRRDTGARLHGLCRSLFDSLPVGEAGEFFNWYERIANHAAAEERCVPVASIPVSVNYRPATPVA